MNTISKSAFAAAAAFLAAGLVAGSPASADQVRLEVQTPFQQRPDRDRDWNDRCRDDRGQRGDRDDRCDNDRDWRDERKEWRDARSDAHWDEGRHNGYFTGNAWHYGPPPQAAYRQRGFALGYQPWKPGQRLGYYNNRYTEVDYRAQNLKRPKRGDHWVRDDRGVYILASTSSGLIRQVLNRNARY
jgi:Ni/Co efflux regulator RcnB